MLYYHPVFDRAYAAGSAYDGYCIPTHRCGKLTNRVRRGADSHRDACVAQLAEQLTRNEQVAGSNPATSSRKKTPDRAFFFFLSLSGVEGRSRVMRMIRDSGRTNIVHTIAKKSNTFTNSGLSASFTPHIRRSAGCRCAAGLLPPRPLRRRCRR